MAASDSDDSIDWLASDEEEYDSAVGLGPDDLDRRHTSLPQTPSSSSRDSPTTHVHSGHIGSTTSCDSKDDDSILKTDRDGDHSSCDTPTNFQDPWVTETQAYAFVGQQQRQSWAFWTTSLNRMDSALNGKQHQPRRRPRSPGLSGHRERPKPEGSEEDGLFAHKCTELQCYIQPLSSILRGLQSGRYSERLSRFQESVAIDRIQRITGVLQNPNMGERYISIILKMEEMLHSWFPHVKAHRHLLTDSPNDDSTPAKKQKQHRGPAHPPPPDPPLCSSEGGVAMRARRTPLPGFCTTSHLEWFQPSPICSSKTGTQAQGRASTDQDPGLTQESAASTDQDQGLTQDSAASTGQDPGLTQDSAASTDQDPGLTQDSAASTGQDPGLTQDSAASTGQDPGLTQDSAVSSSTDPHTHIQPTDPHTHIQPTDPHTHIQPTDPHTHIQPTDPHTHIQPTDPHTHIQPTDPHTHIQPTPPRRVPLFRISSPCLERLLKAKESIIVPRNIDGGRNEKIWSQ